MNTTLKKILLGTSIVALTSTFGYSFAADAELDSLEGFLDELLAEDTPTVPTAPSTQSAEDIKNKLNEKDPSEKTDIEKMLDTETEDHDSAQEILDEEEKWMYSSDKESTISFDDITTDSVKITVTKVIYDGEEILKYRAYYSDQSLSNQKLNLIEESILTKVDDPSDSNMVQITLNKLKPNTKYYVVVSPVHPVDDSIEPLEVITKEISFTTKAIEEVKEPAPAPAPAPAPEQEEVEAKEEVEPVVDNTVYLKSITNSVKDNKVTLGWNKNQADVDKVEISLKHSGENKFTAIGTANFSDASYTLNVTKIGTYFVKLIPLDKDGEILGKGDQTITVKVASITNPAEKEEVVVTNPPKVGPTTDLLLGLLIFAMMMYMMMRFRRAK